MILKINEPADRQVEYFMQDRIHKELSNIKENLQKEDRDFVLCIDGNEGAGKSTLALQIGRFIDSTLDLERICFSAEQFKKQIMNAKKGQVVIYDEAFTGLSSRASLSGINRMLISLMMQMRQKNLFVIVVLPTFFLLDKYVAVFRAKVLINVYENKSRRGYYMVYNRSKKKRLYLLGSKTYEYRSVHTRNRGRFYGKFALGDEKIEKKYKELKEKALMEADFDSNPASKYEDRNKMIYIMTKELKVSRKRLVDLFKEYKISVGNTQIFNILRKFKDKGGSYTNHSTII